MEIVKSVLLFFLAGICELGGAYLIWLWLKNGRSFLFGRSPRDVWFYAYYADLELRSNSGGIQRILHCSRPSLGLAGG